MAQSSTDSSLPEQRAELELCAICLDRPKGAVLRPCGHDHFCGTCVLQLFSCPLCRAPLLRQDGAPLLAEAGAPAPSSEEAAQERNAVVASRTVITRGEAAAVQSVCFGVWVFIFVCGISEATHGICSSGCGSHCSQLSDRGTCDVCSPGYYNFGTECFGRLDDMPSMTTGKALGGTTYFVLIILTQCCGIMTELLLIRRLLRRKLMPRRELVIVAVALAIEIMRMFMVDVFVMQEYFGGRAYHIFRMPNSCPNATAETGSFRWQGADSQWYCDDLSQDRRGVSEYYVAAYKEAWEANEELCSTFTTNSALLNFDARGGSINIGHTRFKTLGWVVGGEFALYYFFATFVNELADNMFVIPTTTSSGWLCKVFSVALEVFQLGALCPAAVFTHRDCLHFTNPLGVSLYTMSTIVILFGYLVWSFVFLSLPLAAIGLLALATLYALVAGAALTAPALRWIARLRGEHSGRSSQHCNGRLVRFADSLEWLRDAGHRRLLQLRGMLRHGFEGFKNFTMLLAFIPLLCGGIFLGTLVVIGQGSKQGGMQVFTAIILLSDVLFKVVATCVSELAELLLHWRVRRALREGAPRPAADPGGAVFGRPAAQWAQAAPAALQMEGRQGCCAAGP